MSDYVKIERSREARLWISQVIVPVAGVAIYVVSNPEAREWISKKTRKAKNYIKSKFSKKEKRAYYEA